MPDDDEATTKAKVNVFLAHIKALAEQERKRLTTETTTLLRAGFTIDELTIIIPTDRNEKPQVMPRKVRFRWP